MDGIVMLPAPEPPPLGTRYVPPVRPAMMAGVGMGLLEFFFTWPSGRASLPGVRAGKKRPA
jgi:hypothetical protein